MPKKGRPPKRGRDEEQLREGALNAEQRRAETCEGKKHRTHKLESGLEKKSELNGTIHLHPDEGMDKDSKIIWQSKMEGTKNYVLRDKAKHSENAKQLRKRRAQEGSEINSSVYRKEGATGTPIAFEARDLKEALLPIATCYRELHSTKWSTCVQCWRAWFAGEPQHGRAHREYQRESKVLSKTALPVTRLASIDSWKKREWRVHFSCSCGDQSAVPEEVGGTIVCGSCRKDDWSRQLVVCEGCIPHRLK